MFRELAVSYLGRNDLAHVEASEMGFDALGKGIGSDEPKVPASVPAQKFLSSGFVRNQNLSNVVVMPQGADHFGAVARPRAANARGGIGVDGFPGAC